MTIDLSGLIASPVSGTGRTMFRYRDTGGKLIAKHCKRCGNVRVPEDFRERPSRPDGRDSVCKQCWNEHERKYRAENRDKIAESMRNYRHKGCNSVWKVDGIPKRCYVCSGPFEEVEHVRCKDLGGLDIPSNKLPVCVQCNRGTGGKHSRPLVEWLRRERPEYLELVVSKVLSYGVDPWTPCEKVVIAPEDRDSGRWRPREWSGAGRWRDVTDEVMADAYAAQRERYRVS